MAGGYRAGRQHIHIGLSDEAQEGLPLVAWVLAGGFFEPPVLFDHQCHYEDTGERRRAPVAPQATALKPLRLVGSVEPGRRELFQ
jgi:hypothetical protein